MLLLVSTNFNYFDMKSIFMRQISIFLFEMILPLGYVIVIVDLRLKQVQ